MQHHKEGGARLDGLDLARCLALVGMVLVNFRLVMGVKSGGPAWLAALFTGLEGRSAATFVVLAGIGLALATRRLTWAAALAQTSRRALFLLALGLLNAAVFPADIIHYYAVFFVLGALCLPLSSGALLALIVALAAGFSALLPVLDYGLGWNFATLSYPAFWTVNGFVRNLLFNGWHPVLPWLAFLLWGLVLARLPLSDTRVQGRMVAGGLLAALAAHGASAAGQGLWPGAAGWFGVAPLPPLPLYLLAGGGVATAVTGACLWWAQAWPRTGAWRALLPAGRMTLTLYIAHILLGMGVLEALGWLETGGQSLAQVALAAGLFCVVAGWFAWGWSRRFTRGPLELFMRWVTEVGKPTK